MAVPRATGGLWQHRAKYLRAGREIGHSATFSPRWQPIRAIRDDSALANSGDIHITPGEYITTFFGYVHFYGARSRHRLYFSADID